jgi:phenylalanyl-tRNA synthetase alpha chain
MRDALAQIKETAMAEIGKAASSATLEEIKVRFLGRKGELTAILRGMGSVSAEERPALGKLANEIGASIEEAVALAAARLEGLELADRLNAEKIDISMPGKKPAIGTRHPITIVMDEVRDVFLGMGYEIAEGPEIETVENNFNALNTPDGHPARDEQDTFYINENILLRTQTSPVQVRVMKEGKLPIRIICPGRVYRADEVDATHSPVFYQIEGLVVDRGVTMGDLVGTLQVFAKNLFGEKTAIRLRPHNFPFTEPSAEVDVTCWACGGKGCRVCHFEGWIEILGAGMVHPNVLRNCGIDPDVYSGFAFGLGVERTAMGRFGINDLRLLYENDLRFLKQFK